MKIYKVLLQGKGCLSPCWCYGLPSIITSLCLPQQSLDKLTERNLPTKLIGKSWVEGVISEGGAVVKLPYFILPHFPQSSTACILLWMRDMFGPAQPGCYHTSFISPGVSYFPSSWKRRGKLEHHHEPMIVHILFGWLLALKMVPLCGFWFEGIPARWSRCTVRAEQIALVWGFCFRMCELRKMS